MKRSNAIAASCWRLIPNCIVAAPWLGSANHWFRCARNGSGKIFGQARWRARDRLPRAEQLQSWERGAAHAAISSFGCCCVVGTLQAWINLSMRCQSSSNCSGSSLGATIAGPRYWQNSVGHDELQDRLRAKRINLPFLKQAICGLRRRAAGPFGDCVIRDVHNPGEPGRREQLASKAG